MIGPRKQIAKIGMAEVQYIPRAMNKKARAQVNKAIDEKLR